MPTPKRRTTTWWGIGVGAICLFALVAFIIGRMRTPTVSAPEMALAPAAGEPAGDADLPVRVDLPSSCPVIAPPSPPAARERELAQQLGAAADRAALSGDPGAAAVLYRQAAEADATDATIAYRLGRTFEEIGEGKSAAREYCRLLVLDPRPADRGEIRQRITQLVSAEIPPPPPPADDAARAAAAEPAPALVPAENVPAQVEDSPARAQDPAPVAVVEPRVEAEERLPAPPERPVRSAPLPLANARAEVGAAIAAYARAIEARDLAALRAIYPELTAREQRQWERFFETARDLDAELSVETFSLEGDVAEVRVDGSYAYENRELNRSERLPVTFRATLTREGVGWRLVSIR